MKPETTTEETSVRTAEAQPSCAPAACSPADLRVALEESIKLQAHYAKLLNMWDGGHRLIFPTADSWIARLRATVKLENR